MLREKIAPEAETKAKQWAQLALYMNGLLDALDDEARSIIDAVESLIELKSEIMFSRHVKELSDLERRRLIRDLEGVLPDAVLSELPETLKRCRVAVARIDAVRVPDNV